MAHAVQVSVGAFCGFYQVRGTKDFHNNTFFVNMTDKEVESVHCIALVIIRLIYIDLKCVIVIGKYKEIYCLY